MIRKITSLFLLTTLFLFSKQDTNSTIFVDGLSTHPDAVALGLSDQHYHLLMGLTANMLGFMMVFLVGFLFVLQGRR